jgi:site-specific DNA recombinase
VKDTAHEKKVGVWIRVSTEDQAQGESPEHHEARAREYAKFSGWQVVEVYDLAGVSGKTVMEHPEARRMVADIRRGHITALIFSKLARLARNTRELLEFADIFRQHDADMISLQEKIDTSSPAGRLFYTMIAAMAQWEREEIADRVKASVSIRAKLGKPLSGVSPYGFQLKDKKFIQNPAEAPIRKQIYELFLQHRRKGVVARILHEAGYRTRAGKKWSDIAIQRLLVCPSAKGFYRINHIHMTGNWKWEEKPEEEQQVLRLEPIVSEELWDQCNRILEEQQKKDRRPGKKPVQLFGGLAHCACGAKMYVRSNSPKYVCTKCLNKIPIMDLEGIFFDELKVFFTATDKIAAHISNAHQKLSEKESLVAVHQREIEKVRNEMTRTHRLYLDGQVTSKGFGDFYKPAEERLNQLQAELPKLQAEVDFLKVNRLSAEEVVTEAEALYSQWPKLPTDDKRKIVESIVEKITIGKDEIDITFSCMPSCEELTKNQRVLSARSKACCPSPCAPEAREKLACSCRWITRRKRRWFPGCR